MTRARPPLRHRPPRRSRLSRRRPLLYVNIQGDEPLIDPEAIDAAILSVLSDDAIPMGTLKKRIIDPSDILNPNVVKVVTDLLNDAIYFSRCPIPFERDGAQRTRLYFKHIGLYVYRRDFLLRYPDLPVGPLEKCRAAGAVARARKRISHSRGGDRLRIAGRRYAGRSGTRESIVFARRMIGDGTANDGRRLHRRLRESRMAKYIFVTGGVVSSLGKGIAAASIGCLLESRGLRVTLQKFDPYLNIDPGTMSPFQHGEVFVTDDGAETDLDLGHYERFTHAPLTQSNNLTSGRIYENIITRERRGDYLGKTVQVIPHVTNEIKAACRKVAADVDVAIVEIGGTVGDIESLAVHRSHSPDAARRRPREYALRSSHAGSLDRRRARAEDQADPAQRQGTARHRYSARYPAVPLRAPVARRSQRKDRAVLRRRC